MNIYFYDYVIISWMHNNVKDVKTGVNSTLLDGCKLNVFLKRMEAGW